MENKSSEETLNQKLNLAIHFHNAGEYDSAEKLYKSILDNIPNHQQSLALLGALNIQQKKWMQAVEHLSALVNLGSSNAFLFGNLGVALLEIKQFEKALYHLNKAIEIKPDYAVAYNSRGVALKELNRLEEALESYEKALNLDDQNAGSYRNKGVVLHELNRIDEALFFFEKAIVFDPSYLEAHSNKGVALQELGEINQSISALEKAIWLKDDYWEAIYNKSLTLLLSGDYENGFHLYESRFKLDEYIQPVLKTEKLERKHIQIDFLKNKHILIYAEQGLGDTLQFCRYVKVLKDYGPKITLLVQKPLFNLLRTLSGIDCIITEMDFAQPYEFYTPLMSLPHILRVNVSNENNFSAYIHPDSTKVNYWVQKLGLKTKPRVGLVWSGGFRADQPAVWSVNKRRNLPFEYFAELADFEIDFFSIQKGEPAESEFKKSIEIGWSGPTIKNYTDELKDFSDTAGLIEQLDLIISVDTSTAHLAAAMGKQVWLLNRFDTCWRWLLDTEASPWYPTLTIFRQKRPGDWASVMKKVKEMLRINYAKIY